MVKLEVFDDKGTRVATLVDEKKPLAITKLNSVQKTLAAEYIITN